jgi:hypothetical protein
VYLRSFDMGGDRFVQGHQAQGQNALPQLEDSGSGHGSGERVRKVVKKVKSPQATGSGIRLDEGIIDEGLPRANVGQGRTKSQVARGRELGRGRGTSPITAGRGRGTLQPREERGKGIAIGTSLGSPNDDFEEEQEEEQEENMVIGPLKLHKPIKKTPPFETPKQTVN